MRWRAFRCARCTILSSPLPRRISTALTDELLARIPQPDKFMTIKVNGSDIRLAYRNIVYAEHFSHMIHIHTTGRENAGHPSAV